MLVVLAGAGVLGREVTKRLAEDGHDVVVIDVSKNVCDWIYANIGAVSVLGDATALHVLRDAKAERADLLVCTLHHDRNNVTCALLGRSLGIERIIARMQDPSCEAAYREAGVTRVVHATHLLANQIVAHVEHPNVEEIMSVRDDRTRIFSVQVRPGAWSDGKCVAEIARRKGFPSQCHFVGLLSPDDGTMKIPRGDDCLCAGDTVLVMAQPADIDRIDHRDCRRRRGGATCGRDRACVGAAWPSSHRLPHRAR